MGFLGGAIWRPGTAIFDKDFLPKPAAQAYYSLVFQTLWTNAYGTTDSMGKFSCRAFYGDYYITAESTDGIRGQLNAKFSSNNPSPAEFTIILDEPPGVKYEQETVPLETTLLTKITTTAGDILSYLIGLCHSLGICASPTT